MFVSMLFIILVSLMLYSILGNIVYYICTIIFISLIILIKKKQKFSFMWIEVIFLALFTLLFVITLFNKEGVILKIVLLLMENLLTYKLLQSR